ncbi:MAG: substrate-binding domain-containing protein [bacterium]|nr:substrate-binding domain-containing protein [bacterium]
MHRFLFSLLLSTAALAATNKTFTIAVIPKGTTHVFWKSIHAGARAAANELGVHIIWQGPHKEDDRKMQIELVQNFISRGVDAIVLAPLDATALVRPVRAATKRRITVVIIDSDLNSKDYASFVATDNYRGGQLAAQHLARITGGTGDVLMLRYAEASASTMQREQGFLDSITNFAPAMRIVSSDQYGGVTAESAMRVAQNLLNKYPSLTGIFCPNESTTFGMLRALQTAGRAAKVAFVGFDVSPALLAALQAGELHGLIVQNPYQMGYQGVKTAVAALQGKPVPQRIDTGVTLVTADNLSQPQIQQLVHPPTLD